MNEETLNILRLPIGSTLNERYKIKKVLATKAIGTIYLAEDVKITAKLWVVKECFPPQIPENERLAMDEHFHKEAERYKELSHQHLAKILDSFTESNREYLVMEYVEGANVEAISQMSVNPLDDRQVMQWMAQVTEALEYLHSQPEPILFRDLCPRYVMLSSQEEIKLVNFGFDRILYPSAINLIPSEYIAPEVIEKGYSFASDIYSLGATAYALLTKQTPSPAALPITEYNEIVSPEASNIVMRCIDPNPDLRFSSAQDLRKEIELYLHPPIPVAVPLPPSTSGAKIGRFWEAAIDLGQLTWKRFIIHYGFLFNPTFLSIILVVFGIFSIYKHHMDYNPRPFVKKTPLAYVLCNKTSLVLVNTLPNQEEIVYTLPVPTGIEDLTLSESFSYIFFTSAESKSLSRISTADTTVSPVTKLDFSPANLLLDPKGLFAYITIPSQHILSIIALATGTPVSLLPTGQLPASIAISNNGEEVFVANIASKTISIYNVPRRTLTHTLQLYGTPSDLVVSPDNKLLVVTDDQRVSVFDLPSKTIVNEIPMERSGPHAVTFSPNGNNLYITGTNENKILTYDAATLSITGKAQLKNYISLEHPTCIKATPDNRRVLVCNGKNYLGFFDSETLQMKTNIKVGKSPLRILAVP